MTRFVWKRAALSLAPLALLCARPAFAQKTLLTTDWSAVSVVHVRVAADVAETMNIRGNEADKGVHAGTAFKITDRFEVEFDYKLQELHLVGTPTFKNFPTSTPVFLTGDCPPGKLSSPPEAATVLSVTSASPMMLTAEYRRDFPGGDVPARDDDMACGKVWSKAVPTSKTLTMTIGLMQIIALPGIKSGGEAGLKAFGEISPDGKSFVVKGSQATDERWTLTFTPTPVK
jgi:hypothetical protein